MKVTIPIAILSGALLGVNQLHALEKWEGTDTFENSSKWKGSSNRGANGERGRLFNLSGQAVYSVSSPGYDNAAPWFWGRPQKYSLLPTGRSWEFQGEVIFPETSPTAALSDAGIGLGLIAPGRHNDYRGAFARLKAAYAAGTLQGTVTAESDFNFELLPSSIGGGPVEKSATIPTGIRRFILRYRHNALSQLDTFQVINPVTEEVLYERVDSSTLNLARECAVCFFMSIDHYATWPTGTTYLAFDNWKIEASTPDPINLAPKSETSKGIAYAVAVTGLGMTGAKLSGTVALTVGTASATLPITGSIDKNGYFALTAKGTGANKGFGCVLLYDVATGTYRPNKNTVTAPKQKAIKF
jgi:hypothetical protein